MPPYSADKTHAQLERRMYTAGVQSPASSRPWFDRSDLGRTLRRLPLRLHAGTLFIFLAGMAVTLLIFTVLQGRARAVRRAQFERQATQVAASLRGRLHLPLEVVYSISSLFDASLHVSRNEFQAFVTPALRRHPGIRALEWIPVVSDAQREQFVTRAREEGFRDFEFKQVGPDLQLVRASARSEYFPIYYMEPPDPVALGFDVASEPTRRLPMDRARVSNAPVLSERIRLVEDPPTVASIAVFLPVYSKPDLDKSILGYATAVFRVHQVIEPAIAEALARNLQLVVSDPSAPRESQLLFETQTGLFDTLSRGKPDFEMPFSYADRTWKISFTSTAGSAVSQTSWMALGIGFLISIKLALAHLALKVIRELRRQVRDAKRLGQYTLVEKLGEGGMGVVYRAKHALLRRPTAIKLLPPNRRNAHLLARFEREVQLTSRLAHPNTISIYDYGRTPEGVFYYAMEYLDGVTLEDLVQIEGPLTFDRAVRILEQVAGALAEAHALGLIHRDIKPANIMLTRRGGIADFVKVLDFGLVKESENESADDRSLSRAEPILGTPLYLAPEAITSTEVDARADLYALGAVAYFLVCGQTVFVGQSVVDICLQHMSTVPQLPSLRLGRPVPTRLEAVIMKLLEKKPEERYQTASLLLSELQTLHSELEPYTAEQAAAFWDVTWPQIREQVAARQRKEPREHSPASTIVVDPEEREGDAFDAFNAQRAGA